MRINSYKQRSLAQRDSLSFQGLFNFPHITGYSELAFSGDLVLPFIFSGGRFLDPEGNFTYNYEPDTNILISGNIATGTYNYWINEEYIAQYPKSNGKFNYFYFNTNTAFDVDLNIMASGQTVTYSYPTTFDTGNSFSFGLTNVITGYQFRIFSGVLELDGAPTNIFDFQTGSFPQTVTTGTNIIFRDLGAERGVSYDFDFTLYTNQGNLTGNFSVIDDIPTYFLDFSLDNLNNSGYANFTYDTNNANNLKSTTQDTFKYGNFSFYYFIDTTGVSKDLTIRLLDSGGNTGNYLAPFVTGVGITHSGQGYSSVPTVSFAGGGGAGAAATVSLLGGYISSINFTSFGSGYTSVPTVSFAGGSPTYSGSGIAILSGYTKTFFNTWGLYTGLDGSTMSSYATQTGVNRYISTTALDYNISNLGLMVSNRAWWDTDVNYAELMVSGRDGNVSTTIITGGYVS